MYKVEKQGRWNVRLVFVRMKAIKKPRERGSMRMDTVGSLFFRTGYPDHQSDG